MSRYRQAEQSFSLAKAWYSKGSVDAAISGLRQTIRLNPNHTTAHTYLGYLLLKQGEAEEALDCLRVVLHLRPEAATVGQDYEFLRQLVGDRASHSKIVDLPSSPDGRIKFREHSQLNSHRSGWRDAMRTLEQLHNSDGVLFDGFLEDLFAWQHRQESVRPLHELLELQRQGSFDHLATSEEKGLIPFREPWIGFLHNPPRMPAWFHYSESPQAIFSKRIWQESLTHCLGLFALSEYQARWLRKESGKPVSVLYLPTEIPESQFDFEQFRANRHKKIVQVGWWLRHLNAIDALPIRSDNPLGYEKIRLVPHFFHDADNYIKQLMRQEQGQLNAQRDVTAARVLQHLPDNAYDDLLAENIVFIHLYDASANNTIVECIARATPLLVNPLPAVVEYLGETYPFYFTDLDEAAAKAMDLERVRASHEYLKNCPARQKLTFDYFLRSFVESEVYQLCGAI